MKSIAEYLNIGDSAIGLPQPLCTTGAFKATGLLAQSSHAFYQVHQRLVPLRNTK